MSYKDLYVQIDNPLNSDETIKRLIEAYSQHGAFSSFYGNIVETYHEPIEPFDKSYEDLFFEFIFNKWKDAVLRIPSDLVSNLIQQGKMSKEFAELQDILRGAPTIRSRKDLIAFETSDNKVEKLMDRYSWPHDSHWQHLMSKKIEDLRQTGFPVEHRLYLNVPSRDLHKLTILLMKKLEEKGMEYYFKIISIPSGLISKFSRSDSLVLYSDTDKLLEYIEVLRELKREHPEINFRKPPILTGKIDGFVGYGSEPGITPSGKRESFNSIRSDIIETSIRNGTEEYIVKNANKQIPGKNMTAKEMFLTFCLDHFMYEYKSSLESKLKYGNVPDSTDEGLRQKFGYCLNDLNDVFRNSILQGMTLYFDYIMSPELAKESLSFNVANGKMLYFSQYMLEDAIRKFTVTMPTIDPSFISQIRKRIIEDSKTMGIDPEKYCFDVEAVNKLKRAEVARRNRENMPPKVPDYGGHGAKS